MLINPAVISAMHNWLESHSHEVGSKHKSKKKSLDIRPGGYAPKQTWQASGKRRAPRIR